MCSLGELAKKLNHTKNLKFWKFEGKSYKTNDSFLKPFGQKIIFNEFKMFSFKLQVACVRNNLAKKHVWLSIETHFGIFYVLAINQNIDTQLCIHVKNHHHRMNYFKLKPFNFFHLNLFQLNVICKS